ncbi:MAG: hypothetical protein K2J77_12980 [Oscillospiraceae bacterium]|nr:hypothetical protein [Oscillospiraceae bacterium]
MTHYKSWKYLNKTLCDRLCDGLRGRITYFLTRYHTVHNAYGRAAIRLDGKEIAEFMWINMYIEEGEESKLWEKNAPAEEFRKMHRELAEKGILSEWDFLQAAVDFLQMPIADALSSENYLVKILAIMDRRVGKRTLQKLAEDGEYKSYPEWVRQFYELRLILWEKEYVQQL